MAKVIIAGGTGLIGKALEKHLQEQQHDVYILTRSPRKQNHIQWDPKTASIDTEKIQNTEVVINLCGESVGDGRWTKKRKAILLNSRVDTTRFLFESFHRQKSMKQYLSASGINAYPLNSTKKELEEEDAFGDDYLSQLVKKWEQAADVFEPIVPVFKLRIAMVLSNKGGALNKMLPLVKLGLASPIGKGSQCTNWVHLEDVVRAFGHAIEHSLDGPYNLSGEGVTNRMFMNELMLVHGKKMWAPNVPAFLLKWVLGEQSTIVLDGVYANTNKLRASGFQLSYPLLSDAFKNLFGQEK